MRGEMGRITTDESSRKRLATNGSVIVTPRPRLTSWPAETADAVSPRIIGVAPCAANIKKALDSPDVAQNLAGQALEPWYLDPAAFEKRLKADYEKYGKLIKLTGAQAE